MGTTDWRVLLNVGATHRPEPIEAKHFVGECTGSTRPVRLICGDGVERVVKDASFPNARMAVNDQVVGALGELLGAPTPPVALVNVSAAFIDAEPKMAHLDPGIAHGSRFIPDCGESTGVQHGDDLENAPRFTRLAVLYAWTHANDHVGKLIYAAADPRLVYSVDHGRFLPGGGSWTMQRLRDAPEAELGLAVPWKPGAHLDRAIHALHDITDQQIADAVARPPTGWGISEDERVALAEFLANGREVLWHGSSLVG